jgi:hypothetical protein
MWRRAVWAAAALSAAAIAARGDSGPAPTLTYRPAHGELVYTFGGAAPVRHVQPGTRIVAWTEDCYDGAVTNRGSFRAKS